MDEYGIFDLNHEIGTTEVLYFDWGQFWTWSVSWVLAFFLEILGDAVLVLEIVHFVIACVRK